MNKWRTILGSLLATIACLLLFGSLYYFTLQNLDSAWTSVRLAPIFALAEGYPLYSTTSEPPWVMIGYGPFFPIMYGPTLLASTPASIVAVATVLAHAFLLVPIGLLIKLAAGSTGMSWRQTALVTVMLFPVLLLIPSLRWVTTLVAVDAPALSLLLLSALSLMHLGEDNERRTTLLQCLGGISLGLAISCKANMAPAGLAFVLWLFWFHGIRGALVFAASSGAALLLVYGTALLLLDPRAIMLNFEVLGNFPWSAEFFPVGVPESGAAEKQSILALKLLEVSKETGLVVLAVTIILLSPLRQMANRILPESQPAKLSALFLLLSMVMVVPAAASVAKWGGAPNSWGLFTLPLALSALFALLHVAHGPLTTTHPYILVLFFLSLLLVLARGLADQSQRQLPALSDTIMERSYQLVKECDGTCYLPSDPLAHLLSGDTFRPNIDVISSYSLGGYPLQKTAFQRAMPPNLEHIILAREFLLWGFKEVKRLSGFHVPHMHEKAATSKSGELGQDFILLIPDKPNNR